MTLVADKTAGLTAAYQVAIAPLMNTRSHRFLPIALACAIPAAGPARAASDSALRFFEGRTESVGLVKVLMKTPYKMRSIGHGKIIKGGILELFQRVEEQGRPTHDRHWRIREIGPGHFAGTMSEAAGPVTVDEIGGRFRFRFKMKGNLAVEQWLTPQPDWKTARNLVTVRKFGITVASSDGTITKAGD